jgi:hypothetical protein
LSENAIFQFRIDRFSVATARSRIDESLWSRRIAVLVSSKRRRLDSQSSRALCV